MKDLWKIKKNTIFTKFFKWMWGVDPTTKYKTACPYYWQYFGSILILPFILLYKAILPFLNYIDNLIEASVQQQIEKMLALIDSAETDEDYYNFRKAKCYKKHYSKIWMSATSAQKDKLKFDYQFANRHKQLLKDKKDARQAKIDNLKYGKFGTIVSYVLGAIAVGLFLKFGYWVLHLFTFGEFLGFLMGICISAIVFGIFFGIVTLIKSYWCNSWIAKIVFWKYIGMFFTAIWTGIRMLASMIKSIYTKSCPTINWVDND